MFTILVPLIGVIATVITGLIMNKLGRKTLLIIGDLVCILVQVGLAVLSKIKETNDN